MSTASPQPLQLPSVLSATMVVVFFSGEHIARKVAMNVFSPLAVNAITFGLSGILLAVYAKWQGAALWPAAARARLFLLGNALLYTTVAITIQFGLRGVPTGWANAIMSAFPLVTLLFSALVLREETLQAAKVLGLLVAAGGIGLLAEDASSLGASALLVCLSAVLLGIQIVMVRRTAIQAGPQVTIAWQQFLTGLLCALGASLVGWKSSKPLLPELLSVSWALPVALVYITVLVNTFCFLTQARLLRQHAASDISAFFLMRPILGLGLASLLLSEPFRLNMLRSAALVGVGIFLIFQGPKLFARAQK